MKITCKCCKEEVEVAMYFYNQKIVTDSFLSHDEVEYRATTSAKAICPCCGAEINERFSSMIPSKEIVRLAIGKGGK